MPSVKLGSVSVVTKPDEDADTSYLDQDGFEERRGEYMRGDFGYIGIYAEIEVYTSLNGGKNWLCNTVQSGGLWDIESDSDGGYLEEIAREEKDELKAHLIAMGIPCEMVKKTFGRDF
jgi:hypothetical protein